MPPTTGTASCSFLFKSVRHRHWLALRGQPDDVRVVKEVEEKLFNILQPVWTSQVQQQDAHLVSGSLQGRQRGMPAMARGVLHGGGIQREACWQPHSLRHCPARSGCTRTSVKTTGCIPSLSAMTSASGGGGALQHHPPATAPAHLMGHGLLRHAACHTLPAQAACRHVEAGSPCPASARPPLALPTWRSVALCPAIAQPSACQGIVCAKHNWHGLPAHSLPPHVTPDWCARQHTPRSFTCWGIGSCGVIHCDASCSVSRISVAEATVARCGSAQCRFQGFPLC